MYVVLVFKNFPSKTFSLFGNPVYCVFTAVFSNTLDFFFLDAKIMRPNTTLLIHVAQVGQPRTDVALLSY